MPSFPWGKYEGTELLGHKVCVSMKKLPVFKVVKPFYTSIRNVPFVLFLSNTYYSQSFLISATLVVVSGISLWVLNN